MAQVRKLKRYRAVRVGVGAPYCGRHLEQHNHSSEDMVEIFRSAEGHFDDVEQIGRVTRRSRSPEDDDMESVAPGFAHGLPPPNPPSPQVRVLFPLLVASYFIVANLNSLLFDRGSLQLTLVVLFCVPPVQRKMPGRPPLWLRNDRPEQFQRQEGKNRAEIDAMYAVEPEGLSAQDRSIFLLYRSLNESIANLHELQIDALTVRSVQVDNLKLTLNKFKKHPILAIFAQLQQIDPPVQNIHDPMRDSAQVAERSIFWLGTSSFDRLWASLGWEDARQKTGPRAVFTLRERLALCLVWMRRGYTFNGLSKLCGLGRTQTTKICKKILKRLLPWARLQISFPSLETWAARQDPEFAARYPNTYMFFVDGTVIRIYSYSIPVLRRMSWNPKHKFASKTFTILVSADGGIVFVTPVTMGKVHDRDAWNMSGVSRKLIEAYVEQMREIRGGADISLAICGDKGYPDIAVPELWKLYLTKSAEKEAIQGGELRMFVDWDENAELPPQPQFLPELLENNIFGPLPEFGFTKPGIDGAFLDGKVAKWRSVVERVFASIKDFLILSCPDFTTWQDQNLEDVIFTVCAIINTTSHLRAASSFFFSRASFFCFASAFASASVLSMTMCSPSWLLCTEAIMMFRNEYQSRLMPASAKVFAPTNRVPLSVAHLGLAGSIA